MQRSEFATSEQARQYFTGMTVKALKVEATRRGITVWGNKAMHVKQLTQWTIGRLEDSRAIAG